MYRSLRLAPFAAMLAGLAGCPGPDPTKFSCNSSLECPSGYHCNLGTGTTAGTFKCASGAPAQKSLTVVPSKFLLATRPSSDGTVRTTLSAAAGGVTSTSDFVGVRAIAKQGNADVASSSVLDDGSVQQIQISDPSSPVEVRIQDDSGHSITVTGYRQQVVMSFAGKDVPGNVNLTAAYDASSATDSLFAPADWIPALTELPASGSITNNVVSPPAYNGMSSLDTVSSNTPVAPQPTATALGWEQIAEAPTTKSIGSPPSARAGAAVAQIFNPFNVGGTSFNFVSYGGVDSQGAPADATPTVYGFRTDGSGWTAVPINVSTTTSPFPSRFFASFGVDNPITRAHAAVGPLANWSSGVAGSTNLLYNFFMAGGRDAAGNMTNKIYIFGDRVTTSNGNKFSGWWDASLEFGAGSTLAQPNANMAYATAFIPVANGAGAAPFLYTGMVLVGGDAITTGAVNDGSGCQYITATSFAQAATPSFKVNSCTADPSPANLGNQFLTTTGGIGFRAGAALTASDTFNANEGASVFLFGGDRSGATTPAQNGLQSDVWKGVIQVVCNPANANNTPPPCNTVGATVATQVSWTQVPIAAASPKPSGRSGAAIGFGEQRKLVVYGGTDSLGPRDDVWELDMSGTAPFTWRQLTLDAAPALAPGVRTNPVMVGSTLFGSVFLNNNFAVLLFGGAKDSSPTSDVWALSRQSAARLLVNAPAGLANPDAATNATMTVRYNTPPFSSQPLYIWNGNRSRWDFVAFPSLGVSFTTLPTPLAYLQPDGSFYFLLNSRNRSTPTNNNTSNFVAVDALEVTLDFQ